MPKEKQVINYTLDELKNKEDEVNQLKEDFCLLRRKINKEERILFKIKSNLCNYCSCCKCFEDNINSAKGHNLLSYNNYEEIKKFCIEHHNHYFNPTEDNYTAFSAYIIRCCENNFLCEKCMMIKWNDFSYMHVRRRSASEY